MGKKETATVTAAIVGTLLAFVSTIFTILSYVAPTDSDGPTIEPPPPVSTPASPPPQPPPQSPKGEPSEQPPEAEPPEQPPEGKPPEQPPEAEPPEQPPEGEPPEQLPERKPPEQPPEGEPPEQLPERKPPEQPPEAEPHTGLAENAARVSVAVVGPHGRADLGAAIELAAKLLQSGHAATALETGGTDLKALTRRLPADVGYLLVVQMGELTVGVNPVMSDMKTARLDLDVKIFTADGRPLEAFGVSPAGTGFSEDSAASAARNRALEEVVRQVGERLPGDHGAH